MRRFKNSISNSAFTKVVPFQKEKIYLLTGWNFDSYISLTKRTYVVKFSSQWMKA